MTPVLVVDNNGRMVCRGQIQTEGGRSMVHLQFAELAAASPGPGPAAAARQVAEIQHQVRRQLEAVDRRRRREVIVAGIGHATKVLGIIVALAAAGWGVVFGGAWALAHSFGFSL
jgi:hypothetical protein